MEKQEVKKILVIKFSGIGDVVNVTPALRLLKLTYPSAQIDFIASEWTAPAIRFNPAISKIFIVKNKWVKKTGVMGAVNLAKVLLKLRLKRYDAALVFQQSHLFKKFVRLAGIRNSVYFCDANPGKNEVFFNEGIHIIDNNFNLTAKLLEKLGVEKSWIDKAITSTGKHTDWIIREEESKEADKILQQYNISGNTKIIGIIAGGAYNPVRDESNIRQWGVDNYKKLLEKLKETGNNKVLLVGGLNDNSIGEELKSGNEDFAVNLAGKIPLRISAALLAKCDLVISNDTGPMHIAGAVGVPIIGIFGPTPSQHLAPHGKHFTSIQSRATCSPCYARVFKGCIYDEIKCMKLITAEEVFDAVKSKLLSK